MDQFVDDSPEFDSLILANSALQQVTTDCLWSEGPVWLAADDCLVWSDIPNNRLLRWSEKAGMTVFRSFCNFTNGNGLDREGRLVSCEHGRRCISRTEKNGSVAILVDKFDEDHRFNSPNDLAVKQDGTIWFTNPPPYGIMSNLEGMTAPSQIVGCHVYRFDPVTNDIGIVAHDLPRPNDLAFSPDEQILYITDMSAIKFPTKGYRHIKAYDVIDGQTLANGRFLAEVSPGVPDGLSLDDRGRIFCGSKTGMQVFSPRCQRLGQIMGPEVVSNCIFGGLNNNILYITATKSLYRIGLNTKGLRS